MPQRALDVGGEIGIGGQFLFIAEDGVEGGGDGLAAQVGAAHEIGRDFVSLQGVVQLRGPLAALLFVVGMTGS